MAGVLCLALLSPTTYAQDNTKLEKSMAAGVKAYRQGRYAEAERQFKAAISEAEKFGEQDTRFATSLEKLAEVYGAQGKYGEAEALFKRELAISEKALGSDHPNVALSLNNLAGLYRDQGNYAQAEPLYKRSLAIREKALGPEDPGFAVVLTNYGVLLRQMDRNGEADSVEARAQTIRAENEKLVKNWKRASGLYQRGRTLYSKGKVNKAIVKYREAICLEPNEAYWHWALGTALEEKGHLQAALDEYRLAYELLPLDDGLHSRYETLSRKLERGDPSESSLAKTRRTHLYLPASIQGGVRAPTPVYNPDPRYSQKARAARLQGQVVIRIIIDSGGNVIDTRVTKPLGLGLDQNAIEAVRTWKFQPGMRDGVPVMVAVLVEFTFRLK